MQGCSPREHSRPLLCGLGLGLGLDTYGLGLEGSVSNIFKTSTVYMGIVFFVIFNRKKQQLRKTFAAYTCVVSAALAKLQKIPHESKS